MDYANYEYIEKDIIDNLIGILTRSASQSKDLEKKRVFIDRIEELRDEIQDLYNNYTKDKANRFEEVYGKLIKKFYNEKIDEDKLPIEFATITLNTPKKEFDSFINKVDINLSTINKTLQYAKFETAYEILNNYKAICFSLKNREKDMAHKLEERKLQLAREQQELKLEDTTLIEQIINIYGPIVESYYINPKEFKLTKEFFEATPVRLEME